MIRTRNTLLTPTLMSLLLGLLAAQSSDLPDPDGKPANMSKPVKVFILMGQSNMLGFGKIGAADQPGSLTHAVKENGKYPYLVDDAGSWTVRKDVRNVRIMASGAGNMRVHNNEWMTITGGNIGPEIGIGHHLGHVTDAPVLILKSCIGNRSLGWDLLPPGSKQFERDGMIYAGYKDSPDKWKKGERAEPIAWYAGVQYDGDTANAKKVLAELHKYYPGAEKYEIAGFFFWQGDKDRYNAVHASRYEQNLVRLIEQLREDFGAPNAKFVCATLGQTRKSAGGNEGKILEGQLAVDGRTGKHRQFRGNVATVYSNPLIQGGASNSHYGGNAETYMNVGEAMGRAMVELVGGMATLNDVKARVDSHSRPAYSAVKSEKYAAAYEALAALKSHLDAESKNAGGADEDQLETQRSVHDFLKSLCDAAVATAMQDIDQCRETGDVYRLSEILPGMKKTLGGLPEFDILAGGTEQRLASEEAKEDIARGRKFYRYIERQIKAESKSRGARSERKSAKHSKQLMKMAEGFGDSLYAPAAFKAAAEVRDPGTPFKEPAYYMK